MSRHAVCVGVIAFALGGAPAARAGLYTTVDSPADTPLGSDFVRVFSRTLGDLRSIGAEKPERESTLRKRYVLMEIGNKGGFDLQTLEEKLNYIHNNPITRQLVSHPQDWPWSSWSHYTQGQGLIPIDTQ